MNCKISRNNCKLDFEDVSYYITNNEFDEYIFPTTLEEVSAFQESLRNHINVIFPEVGVSNAQDCPSRYDIGMLVFIYQTSPEIFTTIKSWNNMKDMYVSTLVEYENQTVICGKCLCGQIICQNYFVETNGKYIILGSECIQKNGGALKTELDKILAYTCIGCDKTYKKKISNDNICKRCSNNPYKMRLKIQSKIDEMTTQYLLIPYDRKDELKSMYKLKWDDKLKLWGTNSQKTYNKLSEFHIIELNVPFKNKDKVKALGAKWSGKSWVTSRKNYDTNKDAYELFVDHPDTDDDAEAEADL